MNEVTMGLIVERFQSICITQFSEILAVTRDPRRENGLTYYTLHEGQVLGDVSERGNSFVFRLGNQEIEVPISAFWGRSH